MTDFKIDGGLIYRLKDGENSHEINVSMWNGSRGAEERSDGAKWVLSRINACEGIDQETLDGGWIAKGMSDYAKQLEVRRDELLSALRGLYDDITGLMSESEGVSGLHLNGNVAPWGELDKGGRFERLSHLTAAREAIDKEGILNAQSSFDLHQLFCEAISWGMVYGPAITADQWDEMRDSKASSLASTYRNQKGNTESGRMCSCVECVPSGPDGPIETPVAFMTADKRMLVFADRIVGDGNGMIPLYLGAP